MNREPPQTLAIVIINVPAGHGGHSGCRVEEEDGQIENEWLAGVKILMYVSKSHISIKPYPTYRNSAIYFSGI